MSKFLSASRHSVENPDNLEVRPYLNEAVECTRFYSLISLLDICNIHTFSPQIWCSVNGERRQHGNTRWVRTFLQCFRRSSESTSSGIWSSPLGSFSHLYPTNSPSAPATSCSQAHLQVPESCRSDISPVQNCPSLTNMFIVPPRSGTRCCWRRYHCRSGWPGHHHISCCCLKTDC